MIILDKTRQNLIIPDNNTWQDMIITENTRQNKTKPDNTRQN